MERARFLTIVCALAGCLAVTGCGDDGKKNGGGEKPIETTCSQDSDCASNTDGRTECNVESGECVEPVAPETCGNGDLDEGEQCDGSKVMEDLSSISCGENKKLKDSLSCNAKTCRIDLSKSCELDPEKAECVDDTGCAGNEDGRTQCDKGKGVCIKPGSGPVDPPVVTCGDADGDTISDELEGKADSRDTDEDGTPDYLDLDSDGDGIPDSMEAGDISCGDEPESGDNGPYYLDADSDYDGNGIGDSLECCGIYSANDMDGCRAEKDENGLITACVDTDGDGEPDYIDEDNDGDGFIDIDEIVGIPDKDDENTIADCDGDGIPDAKGSVENPFNCSGDGAPDYMNFDSDGDGILDVDEGYETAARYSKDSDGDGIADGDEVEMDKNGNKYLIDHLGSDLKDDDGNRYVAVTDGDGNVSIAVVDADGNVQSAELPENTQYFFKPVSATICAEKNGQQECKDIVCYKTADCDTDGLPDNHEVWCGESGWSALVANIDEDTYMDASEYAAYEYAKENEIYSVKVDGVDYDINSAADIICNPNVGVKDIIDFYFELPYVTQEIIDKAIADSKKHEGEEGNVVLETADDYYAANPDNAEKNDMLIFEPSVSKLDLVFNVDTTSSMDGAIQNVKDNVASLITRIQGTKNEETGLFENGMVSDAGFALTTFDDFPLSGYGSGGDLPFRLLGQVSTDKNMVEAYTKKSDFKVRNGGDLPEAGAESLYQIATGEGISWRTGEVKPRNNVVRGTWGGVGFREGTLPVVVHITDAPSHDKPSTYNNFSGNIAYTPADVPAPHNTEDLIPKLKELGIRVITLYVGHQDANKYNQMVTWARESEAVVPVCAFSTASVAADKCHLGVDSAPTEINGKQNQCVLFYQGEQNETADFISQGVDAIVKYGTYEVSTTVRGEPIEGVFAPQFDEAGNPVYELDENEEKIPELDENGNPKVDEEGNPIYKQAMVQVDTGCFIRQVEAKQYVAPPMEPELSCNPQAVPKMVNSTEYNDGFENFAPGTSSSEKKGAELHFEVVAQNFGCVPETENVQVFKAYIDVINPKTGLVFGTREVSIIVPGKPVIEGEVN